MTMNKIIAVIIREEHFVLILFYQTGFFLKKKDKEIVRRKTSKYDNETEAIKNVF